MNVCLFIFTWFIFGTENISGIENMPTRSDVTSDENFQVYADTTHIEEIAAAYAKWKNNKNIIKLKIMTHIKWKTNICRQSKEVKIEFCAELHQIENYGLQFDVNEYKNSKCTPRKFSVNVDTQTKLNSFELSMFSCPRPFYVDLETNEKMLWTYQYYISESYERNSALVFFQKAFEGRSHPQKYATQINFKKLESSFRKRETFLRLPSDAKFSISKKLQVDIDIYKYIKARHITAQYQKFVRLFSSINICGLRRSHKIYMCRRAFNQFVSNVELNFADFDEEKCQNRNVYFRSKIELNLLPKNKLFVLHCSALLSAHILGEKNSKHYYISSNTDSNGFNMFTRTNKKGEKLIPKFYSTSSKTFLIIEDIRRKKSLPWPLQSQHTRQTHKKSSKDLEETLNKIENGVFMPQILTRIKYLKSSAQSLQLITKKVFLDDFAASFSKIKNIKSVYRKFRIMYGSVNVCSLTPQQKTNLCNDILEAPEYQEARIYFHSKLHKYLCMNQRILLNFRETEILEKNNFTMWLCPHHHYKHGKYFYIGKTHIKNAVMLFSSIEKYIEGELQNEGLPMDYLYPEAVAINLEKNEH